MRTSFEPRRFFEPSAAELRAQREEAERLSNELNDVLATNRNISSEIVNQLRNTRNLTNATAQDVAITNNLLRQSREVTRTLSKQISLLDGVAKGLTKELDLTKEINKNEALLNDLGVTRKQIQSDLALAQNDLATQQLNYYSLEQQYQNAVLNGTIKQQNQLFQQLQTAKDNVDAEKDRVKQIQANIDVTDRLIQNYEEGNAELKKGLELLQKQKKEIEETRKKLLENVLNAVTFGLTLRSLLETFKALDKQQTETAKQLGISVDQARDLGDNLGRVSGQFSSSNFALSTLLKGMQELNSALGTSLQFTEQEVVQFTELTKTIGLSVEEATKLYTLSKLNNLSLKQTQQNIVAGVVAANRQFRVQISARDVFRDISKLSAGILVKFQQNPEALAKAVVQAKALGTNLETVDKIGDSLLNFEQSIQSELEAELLTGKAINVERARAAALSGDQAALMQEIAAQAGNLADYQKMNVIQQKSLAQVFGLSRDEMADMLSSQERFSKLGDVAEKSAAEQLKYAQENGITLEQSVMKSLEQQAAQDRLNEAFLKLKETLVAIVDGPMGDFVRFLGKIVDNSALLGTIIGVVVAGGILKAIQGFGQMILLADKLRKIEQATAVAKGIGTALSNPLLLLGGLAAAGLVGAAVYGATKVDDGGIDASGRLIVSGPKGSFIANKADQIALGPGVADNFRNGGGGGGGVTKEDLAALANRPVVVQANLSTGGDTIQKWQTSAGQYGNSGRFA